MARWGFPGWLGRTLRQNYLAGIPNLWYYEEELVSSRAKVMFNLEQLILSVPAILLAIAFHELGHAFVAYKLSDPTPKYQGRLTSIHLPTWIRWAPLCCWFSASVGHGRS